MDALAYDSCCDIYISAVYYPKLAVICCHFSLFRVALSLLPEKTDSRYLTILKKEIVSYA